ncbi:MAG: hypothetical protein ACRDMV_04910 [Streptosporangiales bacterium]
MADDLRGAIETALYPPVVILDSWRPYRDALLAVLNLHQERVNGTCAECIDHASATRGTRYEPWPCSTVIGIADALGVEVGDE